MEVLERNARLRGGCKWWTLPDLETTDSEATESETIESQKRCRLCALWPRGFLLSLALSLNRLLQPCTQLVG
jgi:hypothetical protein